MWNRGKRSVGLGLTNREIAELRYQGLYQVVDLTKNFYFSYTYELTRSLQENFLAATTQPFPPPPFKEMYAWNYFLTREFEGCLHSLTSFQWIMPVIHGAFVQRKVNDYGRSLNIILLARRSRHFAGTRYLKRGVSEEGKVANDVEHEQIVHDESNSSASGIYSSYLQVRGSIPTFWTQESSVTMPKPPIELNRVDPTYTASKLHFEDLMKRYSSPVIVLDLVKQSEKREREVLVGNEFRHAIDYINTTIADAHKVRYCALDYSHISKHRNLDVSASLNEVSAWAVNQVRMPRRCRCWVSTCIHILGFLARLASSALPRNGKLSRAESLNLLRHKTGQVPSACLNSLVFQFSPWSKVVYCAPTASSKSNRMAFQSTVDHSRLLQLSRSYQRGAIQRWCRSNRTTACRYGHSV